MPPIDPADIGTSTNPEPAIETDAGATRAAPTGAAQDSGAGERPRERDERGHFKPRPSTEEGPSGAAVAGILPAQARPAHARVIRARKDKPVKGIQAAAVSRGKREVLKQAQQTAEAINKVLNTSAKLAIGPECEQSPKLRQEIEDPMARSLERLAPAASEAVAKFADPMLLTTALAEWGAQCLRVYREKQALAEAERNRVTDSSPRVVATDAVGPAKPSPGFYPGEEAEPPADEAAPEDASIRVITVEEVNAQMGMS